jgi:hypothetical protein
MSIAGTGYPFCPNILRLKWLAPCLTLLVVDVLVSGPGLESLVVLGCSDGSGSTATLARAADVAGAFPHDETLELVSKWCGRSVDSNIF